MAIDKKRMSMWACEHAHAKLMEAAHKLADYIRKLNSKYECNVMSDGNQRLLGYEETRLRILTNNRDIAREKYIALMENQSQALP